MNYISPNFTHDKLETPSYEDIVDVFEDRMLNWLIEPAVHLLSFKHGSIAAVALLMGYFEGIEIYHSGHDSERQSKEFFRRGYERVFVPKGQPEYLKKAVVDALYRELRCGVVHDGSDTTCELIFQQHRYEYDWLYTGFVDLPKHFFPHIGNLRAEGEEFECAVFIATQLEGVKYWVRNVERKRTSFSLQTCTDRFYPDFLCQLEDGRILIIEYKNTKDWDLPDNLEKRQLGELWERRSNGKGLFIMPRGQDWEAIREKILAAKVI